MMTAKKYQLMCEWFDEDKNLRKELLNCEVCNDDLKRRIKLHSIKKKAIEGMK